VISINLLKRSALIIIFSLINLIMGKFSTFLLLLLLAFSFQSCKKDGGKPVDTPQSVDSLKGKTYLIKKIVEHYVSGPDHIREFAYDDKNRMTNVKYTGAYEYNDLFSFYDHHTDAPLVGGYEYQYTYDTTDRLIGTKIYDIKKVLCYTIEYQYSQDKIDVSRTNHKSDHTDLYTYTLSNGRITQSKYWEDDYIYAYSYDDKGNITQAKAIDDKALTTEVNFVYDNQKSVFAMVKAPSIHWLMPAVSPAYSGVNNIIGVGGFSQTTYKYNQDGFPISAVTNYNYYTQLKVDYEYIIR
jgi:YD repeat-containing protein